MDDIAGFDEYVKDFESFAMAEYRNMAGHCLTEELEVYEAGQNLTVTMPEYISWSEIGYNFLFEYYPSEEMGKGGARLFYAGYF